MGRVGTFRYVSTATGGPGLEVLPPVRRESPHYSCSVQANYSPVDTRNPDDGASHSQLDLWSAMDLSATWCVIQVAKIERRPRDE